MIQFESIIPIGGGVGLGLGLGVDEMGSGVGLGVDDHQQPDVVPYKTLSTNNNAVQKFITSTE